jgi:NADH-quinone oxidoreductase subunit K
MFSPTVYLFTSLLLFSVGTSVFLIKKNAIVMLIGIELMLNAANLNLVGFNQLYNNINGQVFSLFVIVVAAAEAAIALAIILKVYQYYQSAEPDDLDELKEQ